MAILGSWFWAEENWRGRNATKGIQTDKDQRDDMLRLAEKENYNALENIQSQSVCFGSGGNAVLIIHLKSSYIYYTFYLVKSEFPTVSLTQSILSLEQSD